MAQMVRTRLRTNRKAESSGIIINTCGWVRGQGYHLIKEIGQHFEVDVLVVMDEERLYKALVEDMPKFVKVLFYLYLLKGDTDTADSFFGE
jgi:polyribonucleotide 5'-hydroxyl-kinase